MSFTARRAWRWRTPQHVHSTGLTAAVRPSLSRASTAGAPALHNICSSGRLHLLRGHQSLRRGGQIWQIGDSTNGQRLVGEPEAVYIKHSRSCAHGAAVSFGCANRRLILLAKGPTSFRTRGALAHRTHRSCFRLSASSLYKASDCPSIAPRSTLRTTQVFPH